MFIAYFYLLCLFLAFLASFWQMVQAFNGRKIGGIAFETEQQRKSAFFALYIYLTANFVAEIISYNIIPGQPNQLIYCMNMLVHSFALFVFFVFVLRTKLILFTSIVAWTVMLLVFFLRKYWWQPALIINSSDIAGYFVIMAIVSSVFLRQILTRFYHHHNKFSAQIGALCTIYFALGSVTISFTFLSTLEITDADIFVFYLNIWVNLLYYLLLALLFIRNIIRI
jgi:hypothetical protein